MMTNDDVDYDTMMTIIRWKLNEPFSKLEKGFRGTRLSTTFSYFQNNINAKADGPAAITR